MVPLFIFIFYNYWVQDHKRRQKPCILDWSKSVHQCSVITKINAIQSLCNVFTGKYKTNAALVNVKTSAKRHGVEHLAERCENNPVLNGSNAKKIFLTFKWKKWKRQHWVSGSNKHSVSMQPDVLELFLKFHRNTTESIYITLWFESCPAAERSTEQCGEGSPVHEWDRAPSPGQQTITNPDNSLLWCYWLVSR